MNKTRLLIILPPLLFGPGCTVENPALAERARDARLAIMQPARLAQGPRESAADPASTNDDTPAPPDVAEKKKCDDHDRRGDRSGKCEHDGAKHD